jgi:hypothetical protein
MAADRYTKAVLTVIAACLVWLSLGGPSLMTPVNAQVGDRVILAGWIDESGRFLSFPAAPQMPDSSRPSFGNQSPMKPRTSWPLPVDQ